MAAPARFVILQHDADVGWMVEDEYADYTAALIWFRGLVDRGHNVALVDIEEVQNP